MMKINNYHELEEETISKWKYSLIVLMLVLFVVLCLSSKIEYGISLKLVKEDNEIYQTYIAESQLKLIKKKGILKINSKNYHYEMEKTKNQISILDTSYYLVNFKIKKENKEDVLLVKIEISKDTLFQRILKFWKGETQ